MEYKIKGSFGDYLEVHLKQGEIFYTEPGALILVDGDMTIEPKLQGGIGTALFRTIGGGESLFINEVKANEDGFIQLAGTTLGKIFIMELNGEFVLGDGVYLAHIGNIEISSKFGGLSSLTAGSGLFFLSAKGKGTLFLETHGNIVERDLKEGEYTILDNGNLVAAESTITMEKIFVGKGLKGKLLSGEGIMFKMRGPGKLIYQTHSKVNLLRWLSHRIRKG